MAIDDRYARVAEAAEAVVARGDKPTLVAVRDELGGGSYTTISEGMRAWRKAHAESRIRAEIVEIPRELQEAFAQAGRLVWREATAQHAAKLAEERQALEEAHERYEAERSEAVELADALSSDLERATAALEEEQAAHAAARAALHEAQLATEQVRAETRELAATADGVRTRLQALEADLQEARADLIRASEERGRLEGQRVSAEEARQALQQELAQTRAALAEAQSERARTQAEVASVEAARQALKDELAQTQASLAEAQSEAGQLRDRIAALQAQLNERTARLDDLRALLESKG